MFRSLFIALFLSVTLQAQLKIAPGMPMYNAPADSLCEYGRAGVEMKSEMMALTYYNHAIDKYPQHPRAYAEVAMMYAEFGKFEVAKEYLQQAESIDNKYPMTLFARFTFIREEARSKYKFDQMPKDVASAVVEAGRAFLAVKDTSMNDRKAYIKQFLPTYQLVSDDIEAFKMYRLALQDKENNNFEDAFKKFETIITRVQNTGNTGIISSVSTEAGICKFKLGEYPAAKTWFQKSIATPKAEGLAYKFMAQILYQIDKNVVEAEKLCLSGLSKNLSGSDEIKTYLCNIYFTDGKDAFDKKNYWAAATNLDKLVKYDDKNAQAYGYLLYALYQTKQYTKAGIAVQKLLELNEAEENLALYPNLTDIQKFCKNPVGAAPNFKYNQIVADSADLKIKTLDLMYQLKMYDKAVEESQNALAMYSRIGHKAGMAWAYYKLGMAYHYKSDVANAKLNYQKSIDTKPITGGVYSNLYQIINSENPAEAHKILDSGYKLFPDHDRLKGLMSDFYWNKAWEEMSAQNYNNAIDLSNKSNEMSENAVAYFVLGYSYYALGKGSDALYCMQRAKQLDPEMPKQYPQIDQIINYYSK